MLKNERTKIGVRMDNQSGDEDGKDILARVDG
jgi:hypothetical protein